MKKRIISILLSVIMVVAFLPLTVFAEENSFTFCGQTVKYSGAALTWSGTEGESDAILTFTNTEENGSLTLPADVTAWILAVGGGGGGGGGYTASGALYYGNGGNGGEVKEVECVLKAGTYTVNVGAGGSGSNSTPAIAKGSDGKPTKVECNEWSVIAKGGAGGLCRQSKNNAIAGTPLTGVMSNITQNLYGEGGAKGSGTAKVSDETANTGNGGNGGPASSNATNRKGGAGGSGVVVIRIKETDCVFIKSPSGTIFSESCDPEDFVSSVKTALCIHLFGCASDLLQLYYDGVLLSDDRTLSSYGISLGDTLEFRMLPHNGNVYRGTETAELFPNNQLEILIENNIESKDALDGFNALYIGTADSYQQSNINELAKRCNVRSYIFSQSEDGYSAVSEYDLTDRLTMKGETARGISYPADGTADIVATKFVYALYRELIENVNDKSYDKIFLSFNGDLADGADGEDDCLNITKYANALGDSIVGRTDTQILNELKNVLDTLYYEGKIVWLTPGSSYGTDGYTSESTGNFANYILGGYGYKNSVQIPQTDSEVFKRFFFGEYTTLLVEDTLAPGLTVKAIIPQIEEDGVWYDIPDEGYTESRSGEVIKATAESSDDTNQIKVKFDISDYRKWAYEYEMCIQPDLRVKVICDASDEFIQTYTAEEHPDFDNTICTYEGVIDECIYENYEFHIDSPDIKCVEEEIHLHSVECPDCGETVSDSALTKCPKCGADLENSAMVFTAWDKTDSLPDTAGNYYLTSDVSLSANWSINADIALCLNGFNIIRNGGNAVTVNDGGTLSIYDCSEIQHKFTDNNGLWVLDETNGTNIVTGGCIMGINPVAGQTDGIGVFINQGGTLNLNGGNIVGNYASNGAAGVFVGGTFTMNGGSVCGNKANSNGGGVYVSGTFNLSGGSIEHNTATNNGGGVYAAGTFTMYGGNIGRNTSTQNGGGVYVSGRFDMIDGSIIGNIAVNGGGISNDIGKFTIVGGSIADNTATNGGGIYTTFLAANVMTGGIITENSATVGGGLYAKEEMCFAAGTMITMADGTKKAVETLNIGEVVRVFDHENGEVSTASLFDAWQYPEKHSGVVTLHFTNNIDVTVVGGHSFFSRNENKYVAVTKDNVNVYVGHEFYNVDDVRWETLIGYDFIDGEVDTYILTSEKHLNCVANGMLTNEDGFYTTVTNIFEYGDGLQINAEKKAEDIEKYGLWDFENMKYVSRETYDSLNLKYLSVAFGKGLITPEAFAYLEAYWCGVDPELLCGTEEKTENVTAKSGLFALPEKMLLAASPAAIPTTPGVYVGGTLQIIENVEGNLYLSSGKAITLGTMTSESDGNGVAAPTGDFFVGVTMQTPGKFTTNGTADEIKYFTSDNSAYIVTLADDESGLALSPVIKFTKTQAQWEDKAAGKWNLGIVGTFNTSDIDIDFNEKGTSTNVSAVGVIVSAGEHYEQETTRFVYATENENEYCYRAVIKNIPYNVSSEKTITVQFFATVDGKDVLGETKVINLADAYTTAINNGMPTYEG